MDYAALFAAGVAGLVIGGVIMAIMVKPEINAVKALAAVYYKEFTDACIRCGEANVALRNLRANCFLTDTDGVRRRYDKVSRAVRERAEGGEA